VALNQLGGWSNFIDMVPAQDLKLIRPVGDENMPWPGLISGVLIVGFYFWGMNQFIVQRVLSARDVNHARWGALFAGFLKLPVLFIMVFPGVMARYIFPDLENPDLVFPTLIYELLPVGVLGLVLAGLLAALMSSIDSTLNSASTLVTMDFINKLKPGMSSERLMWIGRGVTLMFMLLAVLWAPQIDRFPSLFNYLQQVLSYAVAPVVGILMLGIFWKRMTGTAAFYSLLASYVLGVILFVLNVVLGTLAIHFLYIAPILFGFALCTSMVITLLGSEVVPADKQALHWSRASFHQEDASLEILPWFKNYRVQSGVLLISTFILILVYW